MRFRITEDISSVGIAANVGATGTLHSFTLTEVATTPEPTPLALSGFTHDPGTNTFDVGLEGAASTAYIRVEAANLNFDNPDQSPIPLAGATAAPGSIIGNTIVTDANGHATVEGVSLGAPANDATFIRAQTAP